MKRIFARLRRLFGRETVQRLRPSDNEWVAGALHRPERDAELMARGENVTLFPLAGWSLGTLPENNVFAALEVLTMGPPAGARMLRVAMTRAQCSDLSQSLGRLARAPHRPPGATPDA